MEQNPETEAQRRARGHVRFGWWSLTVFVALGLVLETTLGLRAPWYVDARNETRRLMFTLAHAHGALLSLVNVVYGFAAASSLRRTALGRGASRALYAATVLVPLGFFGGGWVVHDGDPSLAILLVPVGGVALLYALVETARAFTAR